MRSSIKVLALFVVAIGFFVAHSFASSESDHRVAAEGYEGENSSKVCCDNCGACTRSYPPKCQCLDLVESCHSQCKNCVQFPGLIYPPLYQCMDLIVNVCEKRCNPEAQISK